MEMEIVSLPAAVWELLGTDPYGLQAVMEQIRWHILRMVYYGLRLQAQEGMEILHLIINVPPLRGMGPDGLQPATEEVQWHSLQMVKPGVE
jgi:hypothetical protein